ncbi:MAG TPA: hypothetical protein VMU30_09550 [Bacteroidota bacterium]|nr:hypothetical protein [Bacteroidota bacterium]
MRQKIKLCCLAICVLAMCSVKLIAQGGPPMITDDPFTPEIGHWENNIAVQWTHSGDTHIVQFPAADINYGYNEHTQLKIEMPILVITSDEAHSVIGRGNVKIGIKERFLDEGTSGIAISTYPQYQFATATAVGEDDGAQFFLPVEAAKTFGKFHLAAELGYNFIKSSSDELQYGIVGGYDVSEQCSFFAELHQENDLQSGGGESIVNIGTHVNINSSLALIASAGTTLHAEMGEQTYLTYLGVQILF